MDPDIEAQRGLFNKEEYGRLQGYRQKII